MQRKATLCFVRNGDKILMINRVKPPFMGMWNAVGGHLLDGETPERCAVREIKEESGITVDSVRLFSEFTWNYDDETGYALIADLPDGFDDSAFPLKTDEGIVDFMPVDWVLSPENAGVIEDLRVFIADIKNSDYKDYHLIYDGKNLKDVIVKGKHRFSPLPFE